MAFKQGLPPQQACAARALSSPQGDMSTYCPVLVQLPAFALSSGALPPVLQVHVLPLTCASVCNMSTLCPQAALISSHPTAHSGVRPRRKPPMVPKGPSCQMWNTSLCTLVVRRRSVRRTVRSICSGQAKILQAVRQRSGVPNDAQALRQAHCAITLQQTDSSES